MISVDQLKFLERKMNKKNKNLSSRSAIIGYLINLAMEDPNILAKAAENNVENA